MSTNLELITRSLRLLGVVGEGQTATPEQAAECLGHLNMMLEMWTENDIELGWFEQSDTTAAAPLPKWAEQGVVSKFAQVMQAIYPSSSLVGWVVDDSANGYGTIARRLMIGNLKPASMSHMPQGEGRAGGGASILTDD